MLQSAHVTEVRPLKDIYFLNPEIHAISGRTSLSAHDLGIPKDSMLPSDFVSFGSLAVVPKEVIRAFANKRSEVDRYLCKHAYKAGMGFATSSDALEKHYDQLLILKKEFLEIKTQFLTQLPNIIDRHVEVARKLATSERKALEIERLIRLNHPKYDYLENQISFDIHITKLVVAQNDELHKDILNSTIQNPRNSLDKLVMEDTVSFSKTLLNNIGNTKGEGVKTKNLQPVLDTLVPKLRDVVNLYPPAGIIADYIEGVAQRALMGIKAIPRGNAKILCDQELEVFMAEMAPLLTVNTLERLVIDMTRGTAKVHPITTKFGAREQIGLFLQNPVRH